MSVRVVIAEPFAPGGQAVLSERGIDLVSCVGVQRSQLLASLGEAEGLIVRSETRVDRELLDHAPRMRVIGRAGAGVDSIDLDAATQAGILVVNTPAANTIAATEHTFALLLALIRHVPAAHDAIRAQRWERAPFVGSELFGKTLGIVGLGRIGGGVAVRARAFGMHVLAHDPFVPHSRGEGLGVELCGLEEMLERADVVTLHVPLTPHTRGMFDARRLAQMKRDAILVNCARGGAIDEEALIAALDAGYLRGAALDVAAQEPPGPNSSSASLLRHPRVVATPHVGGSTREALERIAIELARDVADALAGKPASGAVNAPSPSGAGAEQVRAYVDLADRLGRLVPQLFDDAAGGAIRIVPGGELADADPRPLISAFLAAFLQTTTERRVSIVNADRIANEIGVRVEIAAQRESPVFAAFLEIAAGAHRVAAGVLAGGPRITAIDGYELDAVPQGAWIVTRHDDVPGMVGRVGTILGNAGVNIATMQVARAPDSGKALMVLAVDRSPEPREVALMRAVSGIERVDAVVF